MEERTQGWEPFGSNKDAWYYLNLPTFPTIRGTVEYKKPVRLESSEGFEDLQLQNQTTGETVRQRVDDYKGMGPGRIIFKSKTNTDAGGYFYPDNTEYAKAAGKDLRDLESLESIFTTVAGPISGATAAKNSSLSKYYKNFSKDFINQRVNSAIPVGSNRPQLKGTDTNKPQLKGTDTKGILTKNSSSQRVETKDGTLIRLDDGTLNLTTEDGKDAQVFLSEINDSIIDYNDPFYAPIANDPRRGAIEKQITKLKKYDESRIIAYNEALKHAGGDPNKIKRDRYEIIAGRASYTEIERIARENGYDIRDVVKYFEHNEQQVAQLNAARRLLNEWGRSDTVNRMKEVMQKYAKDRRVTDTKEWARYQRIISSIDRGHTGIWSTGHKEAIKNVFSRGETGGNIISNLYLQPSLDYIFKDYPTGNNKIIPGNLSQRHTKDLPLYALVNLSGTSWNLADDFVKVVEPTSLAIDLGEGLSQLGEYQPGAEYAFAEKFNELSEPYKVNGVLNPEVAALLEEAVTDGVVAWYKLFDKMQRSGKVFSKMSADLPITFLEAEDWWFEGRNTIGRNIDKKDLNKSHEMNLLNNAFDRAFQKRMSQGRTTKP